MTTEQKAALGVSIKAYEAERAKERHDRLAGRPSKNGGKNSTVLNPGNTGKARDKAGEKVGKTARTGHTVGSKCVEHSTQLPPHAHGPHVGGIFPNWKDRIAPTRARATSPNWKGDQAKG